MLAKTSFRDRSARLTYAKVMVVSSNPQVAKPIHFVASRMAKNRVTIPKRNDGTHAMETPSS